MRDLFRSIYLTRGGIHLGSRVDKVAVRNGMHLLILDRILNSSLRQAIQQRWFVHLEEWWRLKSLRGFFVRLDSLSCSGKHEIASTTSKRNKTRSQAFFKPTTLARLRVWGCTSYISIEFSKFFDQSWGKPLRTFFTF